MRYNFGVGMFELGDFSDTEPAHFRETPMNTTIPNKLALRGADDLSCGSGARLVHGLSSTVYLKSIPVGLTHDLAGACVGRHAEPRKSA